MRSHHPTVRVPKMLPAGSTDRSKDSIYRASRAVGQTQQATPKSCSLSCGTDAAVGRRSERAGDQSSMRLRSLPRIAAIRSLIPGRAGCMVLPLRLGSGGCGQDACIHPRFFGFRSGEVVIELEPRPRGTAPSRFARKRRQL